MTKQTSKAELLKDIRVERRKLEKTLTRLTEEDMTGQGVIGEWSVKDILAHLAAWEGLFLSWYESGLHGSVPDKIPVGISKKDIATLNQQIYLQYREDSLEAVLIIFQNSYQQILAVVEAIPEGDMFAKDRYGWTGKWTIADYIAGNTCNHYYWANTKIRAWLKAQKGL